MKTIIHQWDFETASRFLQSCAMQGAWRASHNLKLARIDISVHNGGRDAVEIWVRLPDKGVVE